MYIGIVARWDKIKNHSAISRLAEYYKNNNITHNLNVVTKWENNLISNFKDRYQTQVNIITPMSSKDLETFYDTHDIIIIPSRFDVSPTVLMEALLRGKPVIISSAVGWRMDYLKVGLNDMIFHPLASGENINNVIKKLQKNLRNTLNCSKNYKDKLLKNNDLEKIFYQYKNLFKKIYDTNK